MIYGCTTLTFNRHWLWFVVIRAANFCLHRAARMLRPAVGARLSARILSDGIADWPVSAVVFIFLLVPVASVNSALESMQFAAVLLRAQVVPHGVSWPRRWLLLRAILARWAPRTPALAESFSSFSSGVVVTIPVVLAVVRRIVVVVGTVQRAVIGQTLTNLLTNYRTGPKKWGHRLTTIILSNRNQF